MIDLYYEMIAEEQKKHPKLSEQKVRILVNDRLAKGGYIPNKGHRDDDEMSLAYFRPPMDSSNRIFAERLNRDEAARQARAEVSRIAEEERWARRKVRAPRGEEVRADWLAARHNEPDLERAA